VAAYDAAAEATAVSNPSPFHQMLTWVAFTYLWTADGWLYVTVVLALYSRRAIDWSMHTPETVGLTAGSDYTRSGDVDLPNWRPPINQARDQTI